MSKIGKRLAETTLNARSGAYRWLRRNHAEITAVFATQAQPSWLALAKIAADEGEDFTPNALRKAWLRLERDLARPPGGMPRVPPVKTNQPAETPNLLPENPKPETQDPKPETEIRTNHGFKLGINPKSWD